MAALTTDTDRMNIIKNLKLMAAKYLAASLDMTKSQAQRDARNASAVNINVRVAELESFMAISDAAGFDELWKYFRSEINIFGP
jgi:hypothetical protein